MREIQIKENYSKHFSLEISNTKSDNICNFYYSVGQSNYYSVSLTDGRLALKFSSHAADQATTFITKETYNDGKDHTLSVTISGNRVDVFMDDHLVSPQGIFLNHDSDIIAAPTDGGLYIGGIPFHLRDLVEKAGSTGSINGFVGTVSDLSFIDEL